MTESPVEEVGFPEVRALYGSPPTWTGAVRSRMGPIVTREGDPRWVNLTTVCVPTSDRQRWVGSLSSPTALGPNGRESQTEPL